MWHSRSILFGVLGIGRVGGSTELQKQRIEGDYHNRPSEVQTI